MTKAAIGWCGGVLFLFGLVYVAALTPMLALAGLTDLPPSGLTDLRVMYGALQIVPGAYLLSSLRNPARQRDAALLAGSLFACIASIRILGILVDGSANQYHLAALAVEIPTALFAFLGAQRATNPV